MADKPEGSDANLEPLFQQLRSLNSAASRERALTELVHQLGQAVTDLVERLEASDPDAAAERLANAIKAVAMPTMPAPQVRVEVPPVPAPIIHFVPPPAADEMWEIRIKSAFGPEKVMTITRKTASPAKPKRAE